MKSKRIMVESKLARFALAAVFALATTSVVAEASDYGSLARVEAFRVAAERVSTSLGNYANLNAAGRGPLVSSAQSWTAHIDWAAHNSDAGGSVDCPAQYIENGIEYAIVTGGRSVVINRALFEAYDQHFDTAFNLVLMTQCHNPGAQQELINAGLKDVLAYLVGNYQPTGIDPNEVVALGQTVLQALATMQCFQIRPLDSTRLNEDLSPSAAEWMRHSASLSCHH